MNHILRRFAALALGSTLVVASVSTADAGADSRHDGHHQPKITVAADHLNNPRQIAVRHDAVYVAEAGTGGPTTLPDGTTIGFTGSVTRVHDRHQSRVQTGLLSIGSTEGDVVGVDSLAFRGDDLYGVATGACDVPPGVPAAVLAQLGKVLRLKGGTSVTAVGDPASFECTNDPDTQGPDTDPYGLAVRDDTFYVADAAGNDLVKVRKGTTSLAAVLSTTGQPVPTSLAFGPDGALYIGTLNFEGGPGQAKVYRYDTRTGALSVYADGLSAITGIAFGEHGTLYVAEWTTAFDQNGPTPDGDVVAIPRGGGTNGRKVIGAGSLHFPGGVGVADDALYVSNWSIAGGEDGPFGPGNHGQLLRISLDD